MNLLSGTLASQAKPSVLHPIIAPKAGPDVIDYRRDRLVANRVLVIGILQDGV